jgi:para-nitrobenzyl esterase
VLAAYGENVGGMLSLPRLIRDGAVLPLEPAQEVFAAGGAAPVPVVLGTNRDEVKLFMSFDPEQVRSFWLFRFPRDRARYERDAAYGSRAWKAAGADEPAAALAAAGRPAFVYRFDWDELPTVLGMDLARLLGAAHGFEIPFVFGHFELGRLGGRLFPDETEASRQALSAQLRSYWAQLAYAGEPGRGRRGDLPAWPAFAEGGGTGGRFLVIDTPEGGGLRVGAETESGPALAREILADASFASDAERCGALGDVARRSSTFGPDAYAGVDACRSTPLDLR